MSFHLTGQDIRIEDDHILVALLQNEDGDYVESSIDLNQFVGNDNGMLQQTMWSVKTWKLTLSCAIGNFHWDGENFSETAQYVHFAIEGDEDVPVLRGNLQDVDGNWESRDLNLAERVVNDNGQFVFQ